MSCQNPTWRSDGTCSFCGSLDPAILFERIEAGTCQLGPTDKNYKVYVENHGGAPFKQTFRTCSPRECAAGPDACTHWTTRETNHAKFYFEHLSRAERERFVQLLNEKKLQIGYPGYFYRLPFFVTPAPATP